MRPTNLHGKNRIEYLTDEPSEDLEFLADVPATALEHRRKSTEARPDRF
jgi:hypothetical protein